MLCDYACPNLLHEPSRRFVTCVPLQKSARDGDRARLADDILEVLSAADPLLLPLARLIAVQLPGAAAILVAT